ncbi:MAG: hypothetical protein HFK05_02210 [Clostridia bacterium]|nr:hypothetical protein [Clostridia bacterium]
MKKLLTAFIFLISVCLTFTFTSCGNKETNEDENVEGWMCSLRTAYDNGLVDEDDLKSIACRQYECYGIEENPYAGAFAQSAQMSAKEERVFKKAYCEWRNRDQRIGEDIEPSDVEIVNYYGIYDGNVAVEIKIGDEGEYIGRSAKVGGVFISDYRRDIRIMHYVEYRKEPIYGSGRLYDIKTAYENGWLDEDDLKSISCYEYDRFGDGENPYSGLYVQPEEKLGREMKTEIKSVYLEQILKSSSDCLSDAYIYKYFGKYNGNIVVGMSDNMCRLGSVPLADVGGVSSINWKGIYVYRLFKDQQVNKS